MYICDISLFLQYLTPFEHIWKKTNMFIISSILTVVEGSSNDNNDVVSCKARGRAVVDLHEIFAIY